MLKLEYYGSWDVILFEEAFQVFKALSVLHHHCAAFHAGRGCNGPHAANADE